MSKWLLTVLFLVGSAFLTRLIPFSLFFRYVDTMVHEFGHAVTALLLAGRVLSIELYPDQSGVTLTVLSEPWVLLPVALSGYMAASLFAWLLFYLDSKGQHRKGLGIAALVAIVMLGLFVRNGYGMLWLTGFVLLLLVMLIWGGRRVSRWVYWLIAFLSLEESVMGPLTLLIMAWNDPAQAGDATSLARATAVPALVWAGWFLFFSLWCAKHSLQHFFGYSRKRKSRRMLASRAL